VRVGAAVKSFPKPVRIELKGQDYRVFKFQLHEMDGWRCRICGEIKPLTVSHMISRARHRQDTFDNCISACFECHALVTIGAIIVK
jgi:5-methylcytosine-specific restriction endonuclease McrA